MHDTHSNHDQIIEADIIRTLKDIGLTAPPETWRDAAPVIDPDGQTLRLLGHPVMERWEEPYMKKLAEIATSKVTCLATGGGGGGGQWWGVGLAGASRRHSLKKTHPPKTATTK